MLELSDIQSSKEELDSYTRSFAQSIRQRRLSAAVSERRSCRAAAAAREDHNSEARIGQ